MIDLKKESVTTLSGIGAKTAAALGRAGIETFYDLLCRFPRTYEDHTPRFSLLDTSPDTPAALVLRIVSAPRVAYTKTKRRIVRFSARLSENEPAIHIAFFNQPYLVSTFHIGEDWLFYGRVTKSTGGYFMFSPSFEKMSDTFSQNVPVYSQAMSFSGKRISRFINACLDRIENEEIVETLPEEVLTSENLPDIKTAFFEIHRPESRERAKWACSRFAFEEMFNFSVASIRLAKREDVKVVESLKKYDLSPFINSLPFKLTSAQMRVIGEIEDDLTGHGKAHTKAMRRLLQGDVGSGKTAVAAAAMYTVSQNGANSLIMAPTEILALQHHATLTKFFSRFNVPVYLLTGSTTASERRKIEEKLTASAPWILVGTHALFESGIKCEGVRLVVTDEQHRFGVVQREKLLSMASGPNSLVMSATPIPRTLAMFLYAGLDVSKIDEYPTGRQKIETYLIPPSKKERMYSFVKNELEKGRQGYVICPLVEDSEEDAYLESTGELISAQSEFSELSSRLTPFRVGLLHGKMKPSQKESVMSAFSAHEIDLLVSTTVVEVGVDVPNATVMAIENAERFGLAQLHQLRGRIGRGSEQSTCILITPTKSRAALERLSFLCQNRDGFKIAEYDLEKRGPGDFFGYRQHGDLPFVFTEKIGDSRLFERALHAAKKYEENKEI